MPSIHRQITVSQPVEAVWDYLADFTHTEEWDPPTQRTVRREGDGGVGTVYENTSKLLGREVDITYTVVEHRPPHRLQLHGESSSMTSTDTITVEPAEGAAGTTVTYDAEFHLDGAAKLAEPLMPPGLKKLGDAAEEGIRRCLEGLGDA